MVWATVIGKHILLETELYYVGSRYYDPEVGRWINADSLLDNRGIVSLNLFQYCGNNPVNNTDPNGNLFGAVAGISLVIIGIIAIVKGCSSKPPASSSTPSSTPTPYVPTSQVKLECGERCRHGLWYHMHRK